MNNEHLSAVPDHNFASKIHEGSALLRREWDYDRNLYLNASEAGHCIRRLWFEKNDVKNDCYHGVMKRGHLIERYVLDSLVNVVNIKNKGEDGYPISTPTRIAYSRVSGNADFLYHLTTENPFGFDVCVGEIKSVTPQRYNNILYNGPYREHVEQLKTNMALNKKDPWPPKDQIVKGVLLYVDCSNLDNILEYKIPEISLPVASDHLNKMNERATRIFSASDQSELPAEGKYEEGYSCDFCQHTSVCKDGIKKVETKPLSLPPGLLRDYKQSTEDLAASKKTHERLRKDVLDYFKNYASGTQAEEGDLVIRMTERKRAGGIDAVALVNDGVDHTQYMKQSTSYRVLSIEEKK